MTKTNLGTHPALESIQHQADNRLFKSLALEFNSILEIQNPKKEDILALNVPGLVYQYTGMKIKFVVEPANIINAYVMPPELNQNHALLIQWYKNFYSNDEAIRGLKKLKSHKLTSYVDRKSGKVSGYFSTVEATVAIYYGCFGGKLTGEEIAAILMHELGHLFGWYELLANQVTTNQALRAVKETFLSTNDKKLRVDILKEIDSTLNVQIEDKEMVADTANSEASITAVVLKAEITKSRSELGSTLYDQRGFEYLADQYAIRMGAGVHLATGLDKLYKEGWHPSYRSIFTYSIMQLVSIMSFSAVTLVTWGIYPLLLLLLGDPLDYGETESYDRPGERFARMRRELVDSLKKSTLPKDVKVKILDQIEAIRKVEEKVTDRWGIGAKIYGWIFPSARKIRNKIAQQQLLEELANNRLYESAAKLSTLA